MTKSEVEREAEVAPLASRIAESLLLARSPFERGDHGAHCAAARLKRRPVDAACFKRGVRLADAREVAAPGRSVTGERRRRPDDRHARLGGAHPAVECVGVPPGDKVLHALHNAEHSDLRWVRQGARELPELGQGRGHIDPATRADDRRIGQAQEVLRLEIERPQLRLALEGPIQRHRFAWRTRSRCS